MQLPDSNGSRILVVDDDPVFRQLAISRMERENTIACEAQDGLEAWQLIRSSGFDLALIDLDMPNMNGFALIQCIRSFPATRHMPLVVITSRDDVASVQKALEVGATGFLTKPLNWSMFLPYIKHMLDLALASQEARVARREMSALANVRGSITEVLTTELRSRSRRIAATATRALDEFAASGEVEKLRVALTLAQTEANAQRRAVEALAPYAELLTKPGRATPTTHPLTTLLRVAATDCEQTAQQRGVTLLLGACEDIGLHCPRDVFVRCVSDVVLHAIARSEPGSSVSLNAFFDKTGLSIHVTDQGPPLGVHLQRLLVEDRGGRDAPTPPLASAAEIGIAMASSLAAMMDGRLSALPQGDHGSTVKLFVPATYLSSDHIGSQIDPNRIAI
jgi:CheY-like chemotaxis protein